MMINENNYNLIKNSNYYNFGLLYNKYYPIEEKDKKIKPQKKDEFLKKSNIPSTIKNLVIDKQKYQSYFCDSLNFEFETIVVNAKLTTDLVIGMGNSHISELGFTHDHCLGIPYIPASTIKGICRYSNIINNINKAEKKINKNNEIYYSLDDNLIDGSILFGGEDINGKNSKIGELIFLDSYPVDVPILKLDIMTPHFGTYYKNGEKLVEYEEPVPIPFVIVEKNKSFVFRVLIKKNSKHLSKVKDLLEFTLTELGIGGKTSLGYGRFEIIDWNEPKIIKEVKEKENKEIEDKKKNELLKKISKSDLLNLEIERINEDPGKITKNIINSIKNEPNLYTINDIINLETKLSSLKIKKKDKWISRFEEIEKLKLNYSK